MEFTVRWPLPLINPKVLHKKRLNVLHGEDYLEPYYPKIVDFQDALQELQEQASDGVESTENIPLPFKFRNI